MVGGVRNHQIPHAQKMKCVKRFCLFCANIVGSGLVGCCVVVVVAFVDADVINSVHEVGNIFSHLAKNRQFVGNFVWLFIMATHKNCNTNSQCCYNRNGVASTINRYKHCLRQTMQKQNTF